MENILEVDDDEPSADEKIAMWILENPEIGCEASADADATEDHVYQVRLEAAEIRIRWELECTAPIDGNEPPARSGTESELDHDEIMEVKQEARRLLADDLPDRRPEPLHAEIVTFVQKVLLAG